MNSPAQWTPELVEAVLVEALRWCNRAGGLAGPGGFRSSMPEVHMSWEDRLEEGWDPFDTLPEEIPEQARQPSPREAQRLSDAYHWVADHIVVAKSRPVTGRATNIYIEAKVKRQSLRSAFRRAEMNESVGTKEARKGLAIISVALDKKGEPVWLNDASE